MIEEEEFGLDGSFTKYLTPGALGVPAIDDREPDCHRWLLDRMSRSSLRLIASHEARQEFIPIYGFLVPTPAMLDAIIAASPRGILDYGCGNGYLAFLLRARGADVVAVDSHPPEELENSYWLAYTRDRLERGIAKRDAEDLWKTKHLFRHWTEIERGGLERVAAAGAEGRTLLLAWPPYQTEMASAALEAYTGPTVAFIGESWGCTGDDRFHDMLETWPEPERLGIPRFPGLHDALYVYTRGG